MDGVRHLKANDPWSRYIWCFIIIVFVILALFQIYSQIKLFHSAPVATNIDAQYASAITFPTIVFLTFTYHFLFLKLELDLPIDMELYAAHWKSRMILGCTWPNGTSCRLSDFKPVWTLSGLCWAINTNPDAALEVVGSGVDHALRLLLNVETYERIDACTNHFRTNSIPGLKILMYNQTDIPLNSHNGVNIPAGYSVDIRFRMQYHRRLPGDHCIAEVEEYNGKDHQQFDSAFNLRTCKLRKALREVEYECECSMARAFTQEPVAKHKACTVDDYFGCVKGVIERAMARGLKRVCLPSCESVEYIAMQLRIPSLTCAKRDTPSIVLSTERSITLSDLSSCLRSDQVSDAYVRAGRTVGSKNRFRLNGHLDTKCKF
uniref:Amiloride-sensitive sodium channel n=1 Tax=Angiostrongylus cantonensis TaxID=6313 RepID=A0A0K0DIV3_ANGCA